MFEISLALTSAAFVAGLLMFLAPCTLPLVPGYLAFISGVKSNEVENSVTNKSSLRKIRHNALAFVLGFSLVFILFGILAGMAGSFIGEFRGLLSQIGGLFIILFAFMMLNFFSLSFFSGEKRIPLPDNLHPGHPFSAGLIGVIFALGWTPCVGPVLASVLLLASVSTTAVSGAFLLAVFSAGLAVPFMLVALLYEKAQIVIERYGWISNSINIVGGLFLLFIGLLLLTNSFGLTVEYGYRFFNVLGMDILFDHL